jgi:hypothetical protein
MNIGHGWGRLFPICVGMPAFALASYYWIERPGMRLGAWLLQHQPAALTALYNHRPNIVSTASRCEAEGGSDCA